MRAFESIAVAAIDARHVAMVEWNLPMLDPHRQCTAPARRCRA